MVQAMVNSYILKQSGSNKKPKL